VRWQHPIWGAHDDGAHDGAFSGAQYDPGPHHHRGHRDHEYIHGAPDNDDHYAERAARSASSGLGQRRALPCQ